MAWPLVALSDVCAINPRLSRNAQPADDCDVTFVPMAAVDEHAGTIVSPQIRPYAEVRKGFTVFADGDVLFAKITPCMENGKAAVANQLCNGLGFGSTEFHVLRASPDVLPQYLFYYVRQEGFRREAKANFTGTAGQQRVPTAFLQNRLIPLPPLAEQRRIVDILDRAAAIQRLRKAAEEKAREIIPALFVDMFGDPATNPKGWPVATLDKQAEIQGGLQVSTKRNALPIELPYLRVANVFRGKLNLSEIKTIRVTAAEALRARLMSGDILVVEGHGNPNELGRAAIWDGSINDCTHQNHLIRIRPRQQGILPDYVEAFLNNETGRMFLVGRGKTTSGLNTISTQNVRDVSIFVPPLKLQQQFAQRASAIRAVSSLHADAVVQSQNIAGALTARLLG